MRLPILILVHIATAHRVDLDLTATTGEGSNTSSIAATVLQNSTAVVGTHGSDRGVLSRAGPGIPGKLMQRLALILAASSVLGGPLPAVAAKAMPTAFVAPGVRRNALSGSGFLPSAMEAAGPGSGIPDPSGQIFQEAAYKSYRKGLADFVLTNNVGADPVPLTMVEKAYVLLKLLEDGRRLLIEERRDAEAAAEGMTKELEAEYKSQREALDDVLLNTVDAVPRIIEEAYVFLKLLREERRSFIEGRRDAEAAAVAPIDAAGPGSGVPDPSGRGSFMDEWKVKKRITADLAKPIAQLLGPKGGLPKTKDKLILLAVALDIPSTGTVAQLQARCRAFL